MGGIKLAAFDPTHYPTGSGCYLMRDELGTVLYVGKAKNIRRRLGSHFSSSPRSGRRSRLLAGVADIELILVNNDGLVSFADLVGNPELRQAFEQAAKAAGKQPAPMPILADQFVVVGDR